MRKRLKVTTSCDTCRLRKVKCNGARLVCSVCSKRKDSAAACSYSVGREINNSSSNSSNNNRARTVRRGDSTAAVRLQPQPRRPELRPLGPSTLAPNRDDIADHRRDCLRPARSVEVSGRPQPWGSFDGGQSVLQKKESGIFPWSTSGTASSSSSPYPLPRHPGVTDSMTGVVGEPSASHEFFGSSSAGSFMRQMQHAIDTRLGVGSIPSAGLGMEGAAPSRPGVVQRPFSTTRPTIDYVLPPRNIADELADAFWELVYPLYPFLDRFCFERFYESVWTGSGGTAATDDGDGDDDGVLLCTMNVIFALGAQVSGTIEPEQRWEKADAYFRRADGIREACLRDNGSVSRVSCLLLMGIYLQSANIPQRCWMVVGYAIRMAQILGLHLPDSFNASARSQREQEVVRRIWHGCILMDRVLAMTFGRPAMIPKWLSAAVPLPSMIDDEFLDLQVEGCAVRPDNEPCIMEFYVSQLRLHDIMDNVLLKLYMAHDGRQNPADLVTVFTLDEDLMHWTQGLSGELELDAPLKYRGPVRHRLAVVNRARFFHARMLLLRPALAQFCLSPHAAGRVDSLASRMDIQCSSLCLETAHRSIELIYSHLDRETVFGPVPAWWYSVLYVYTAATVLLAERIRPEIGSTIAHYSNAESWRRAIQILNAYARISHSAKRCVAALEILSAKIPGAAQFSESFHGLHADASTGSLRPSGQLVDADADADAHAGLISGVDLDGVFLDLDGMGWLHSVPEVWPLSTHY